MASDNSLGSISVSITGDISQLNSDFAKAQTAAARAGTDVAEAFTKAAERGLSGGRNAFGVAVGKIISEPVKAALPPLNALGKLLGDIANENKAAAAAAEKLAEAQKKASKEAQSFVGIIPGFGVAAERFIALVPGLGQALMSMFPLLGAIAFGQAVIRVGENLAELVQGAGTGGSEIRRAFAEITDGARASNDELQVANDRLASEIAKIEKKPTNGLAEALDDARVAVDKLGVSLAKALKTAQDLLKANSVGFVRQALGEAGTGDIEEGLKAFQQKIANITAKGNLDIQSATVQTSVGGVSLFTPEAAQAQKQAAQTRLNTELTKAYGDELARLGSLLKSAQAPGSSADSSARIESLRGEIALLQEQQRLVGLESQNANLKGGKALAQDKSDAMARAAKTAQETRDFDDQRRKDFEKRLKEAQEKRDQELRGTAEFNDKMLALSQRGADDEEAQQQRWTKINIDAKDERIKQAKIDNPQAANVNPAVAAAIGLGRAGILTGQMRQAQIAEDQILLNNANQLNVPLETQLRLREQILEAQVALAKDQGRGARAEENQLNSLRLRRQLMDIGGSLPGQIGGAAAGAIVSGQNIGQEIKSSLQGIGQQILGTVFQAAIQQLIVTLGVNTAATAVLNAVFGTSAVTQTTAITANTVAVAANTAAQGTNAGVQAASVAATAASAAGAAASAATGGLLSGVVSGLISAAGSIVGAVLIVRAIHGTTSAVNALRRSGFAGETAANGSESKDVKGAGLMDKLFGSATSGNAVRVDIVAISVATGGILGGGLLGSIGALFGFASGGRPPVGVPSLVGERGPELFVPDQSGTIIPNHRMPGGAGLSLPNASASGGGMSIGSMMFNVNGAQNARETTRQIANYLRSSSSRFQTRG